MHTLANSRCPVLSVHGFKTGDETVTRFKPESYHTSVPGYDYGCLIASLIDCHSTGTAAAAIYRSVGREMIVETTVVVDGVITARGEVVAVQMPGSFGAAKAAV